MFEVDADQLPKIASGLDAEKSDADSCEFSIIKFTTGEPDMAVLRLDSFLSLRILVQSLMFFEVPLQNFLKKYLKLSPLTEKDKEMVERELEQLLHKHFDEKKFKEFLALKQRWEQGVRH